MYITCDVGGTAIKHGLVGPTGEILEQGIRQTPQETEPFLMTLIELIRDYQKRYESIFGIGLSVCGTVTAEGLVSDFGALKALSGLALSEKLHAAVNLPLVIENDANCATIAEKWLGAGKNMKNFLLLALGTGVGGGIVLNGELYRGEHGLAGEFGWSLSNGLSASGDLEDVSDNISSSTVYGLLEAYNAVNHGETEKVTDARLVIERAQKGDKTAGIVFDRFLTHLVINCLNLTAAFDPEAILIGGAISANDFFIEKLQEKWQEIIDRHSGLANVRTAGQLAQIKRSALKNDAGMLGAAYLIQKKVVEINPS